MRALEQQVMQLGRIAPGILLAQQPPAGDVLVDLRLQFQLQQRHAAIVAGVPGQVEKMADALERSPVVGQIAAVQRLERIGAGQPLQQLRIEKQAPPAAMPPSSSTSSCSSVSDSRTALRQPLALGEQEVIDVVLRRQIVDAGEQILQLLQHHGWSGRAVGALVLRHAPPAWLRRRAGATGRGRAGCRS